jgi:catechol 2,3-dioxygenase-like lactoylglutathione lyase family enzyme
LAAVIDHLGLEVSDLAASARFYDALFYALGARRLHDSEAAVAWGTVEPTFWIVARGRPPEAGYGHVALKAFGRAAVDAAHAAGLAHGGTDDGAPGPRPQYGRRTYAGYLRDPDGLRIEVVSVR